jgi:hypothetical protein
VIQEESSKGTPLKQLFQEALDGLKAVPLANTAPTPLGGSIRVTTLPNCPPCERLKRETLPVLKDIYFIEIVEADPLTFQGSAPRLEIVANGRRLTHQGFISVESFRSLVK